MKLITLYLPEPYIKALNSLVNAKLYPSRAVALRTAVRDFLDESLGLYDIYERFGDKKLVPDARARIKRR